MQQSTHDELGGGVRYEPVENSKSRPATGKPCDKRASGTQVLMNMGESKLHWPNMLEDLPTYHYVH